MSTHDARFTAPAPFDAASAPTPTPELTYAISAVERETGLSKDTLRMWERRYGFPLPERDGKGERTYSAEQVARLRHLCRLVHTGHRPGQVVPLVPDALERLLATAASAEIGPTHRAPGSSARPTGSRRRKDQRLAAPTPANADLAAQRLAACVACIAGHDPVGLREQLMHSILTMGLEVSVLQLVVPLTRQVGQAWAEGRLEMYQEHLYTECVSGVLRASIGGVPAAQHARAPRVLLTTAPREQHGLGLLMLEALLALRGCVCLPLGTQMPLADIARAAQVFRSDIVALSFSGFLGVQPAQAALAELRSLVPMPIEIWAGGQGTMGLQSRVPGVRVLAGLHDIALALAERSV